MFVLHSDNSFCKELQEQFPHITFSNDSTPPQGIISNQKQNCEVYAPEIDWYLKNSLANDQIKLENINRLFQNQLNIYNHAPFQESQIQVSPSLALIGFASPILQEFKDHALQSGFEVCYIPYQEIVHINGQLGSFQALMQNQEELTFSQAVLFVPDDHLTKFLGILSIQDFHSSQEVIDLLTSRLGLYHYKTTTLYTSSLCQYHERRLDQNGEGFCHKCVNVCPSFGVTKDDSLVKLNFSQIDCQKCGECVAVCPTGAVEFAPYTMDCLIQTLRFYQNTHILVIREDCLETLQTLQIPEHISPLILPNEGFLSEVHLLSMIQESGNSILLYAPTLSETTRESIELINEIYQAIFQVDGVCLAQDLMALQSLWNCFKSLPHYAYTPSPKEAKRRHFGERLRFLIKDNDFGSIKSGKSGKLIRYGAIQIDEEKCTLCNSCVGACNVDSLIANSKKLTLEFNPSLCTTCGYCVSSCPEDAITLELSGIALSPQYFTYHTMAQDFLFECISCGKPFATNKSIQKIKTMMTPHFANDSSKLKSLECCGDCKVKIMFEEVSN